MNFFYFKSKALIIVILASLLISCKLIKAQITILEPQSLVEKLNTAKISGSTATFGTPYYGARLVGKLMYYNTTGCNEEDYTIPKGEIPIITMINRGDCDFIEKTYLAEKKGASALIIVDSKDGSTYRDVRKVIMSKGSNIYDVEIPSILIGNFEGSNLSENYDAESTILLELSWSMPKSDWTEMDVWISPAVTDSMKFIENFSVDALALKQKLDFYPHYWVISLKSNYTDKCWDSEGNYCSVNAEWDPTVTGRQLLDEIIREVCLYETTQLYDYPQYYSESWWKYMSQLRNQCMVKNSDGKTKFGEDCSYNLMKDLGVDVKSVQTCTESLGEDILQHEAMTTAWSPMAVIINGWHYSGEFEANTISKAVCTGFFEIPDECVGIFNRIENGNKNAKHIDKSRLGSGAIIAAGLIASIISIISIALIFWKFLYPRIHSNMRYVVMNEVQKEVQRHKGDPLPFDKREIGQPRPYLF